MLRYGESAEMLTVIDMEAVYCSTRIVDDVGCRPHAGTPARVSLTRAHWRTKN